MEVTVTLAKPVLCGTELNVAQSAIPAGILPEMCYPLVQGVAGAVGDAFRRT